jgi:hypothetical protein
MKGHSLASSPGHSNVRCKQSFSRDSAERQQRVARHRQRRSWFSRGRVKTRQQPTGNVTVRRVGGRVASDSRIRSEAKSKVRKRVHALALFIARIAPANPKKLTSHFMLWAKRASSFWLRPGRARESGSDLHPSSASVCRTHARPCDAESSLHQSADPIVTALRTSSCSHQRIRRYLPECTGF